MRHFVRLISLALALPLALAACSSSSNTSTSASPAGTQPSAAASSSSSAAVAPATGTDLKHALVTTVPSGFKLDKSGTVDTGTDMQDEKNGSAKSSSHCADLDGTGWIEVSGMSGVSFAQSDYLDGHDQEIAQEVDAFDTSADAARAMSQLTAFMHKCKTFAASKISYHLATSPVSGIGSNAIAGTITSSRITGGVVEVAALSGTNVVTVLYSARSLTTAKSAKTLAAKIVTNLQSQ